MYTEKQLADLEKEERDITDEAILAMLLIVSNTKGILEKELRDFYSKYGKDGVVTYAEARKWISEKNHERRLTALLAFLATSLDYTYIKIETHFRRFLTDVIGKESTFFGVSVNVDNLLEKKWGVDELYWLDRLEADINLWKVNIAKDFKQAMHRGASLDSVLQKLDKRFTSIKYVLDNLGLSESTAVGSLTRQEIFKELGIKKYQFYTKADERTCEVCGSMHGLIFPISAYEVGVTASPLHPRCRCWEVPIKE